MSAKRITQTINSRWLARARKLGFKSELELWETVHWTITASELAAMMGVTDQTVRNRMKRHGLRAVYDRRKGVKNVCVARNRLRASRRRTKKVTHCVKCGKKLSMYQVKNICWACQGTGFVGGDNPKCSPM